MAQVFGAPGVNPSLRGQQTIAFDLEAGMTRLVPSGTWVISPGPYTAFQEYDPVTGIWRRVGNDSSNTRYIASDGVSFRLANQSGCCVGALVTNGGSGYTSVPVCTANGTGAPVFQCIVGGAVSTSVSVTNGGKNYVYPPIVQFDSPPAPGIQATGYATISAGAVTAITIVDQGAGYTNVPVISLTNDPRDTTGYGAAAVATLTGSGTVTGVLVTDHGNAVTSLPTLSFAGGGGTGAAATAIMNWAITAYTVTSAGSGYSGSVEITGLDNFPGTSPAYTNVTTQSKLVRTRKASIVAALSGGALTATGQTVLDGGCYTAVPTQIIYGMFTGTAASIGNVAFTVGGVRDVSLLIAA